MVKYRFLALSLILALPCFAGVNVTSPAGGSTVTSPVTFTATATTSCPQGVASIGLYTAPYVLAYVVNGASLNTQLTLNPGTYSIVVQEWDFCGGASGTPLTVTVTNKSGVVVSSPANNSTVGSPVNFVASATTTCPAGVASMGIYTAPYQLAYVSHGSTLNTSLNLGPGTYNAVVQEWDYCGGAAATPVTVTVGGNTFWNLQNNTGWIGWGELAPTYDICSSCGSGITWSLFHGVGSPSLSGSAAQFNIGGTTPYSDALWNNHLIGDGSTQGLPDYSHTLVPTLSTFTYDVYFYTSQLQSAQSLEFDIGQFFNGMGFLFGHECRLAEGHVWAVWDNVNAKWNSTSIPCNPVNNSWNHLVLQVQRTGDNWLWYKSITLNGATYQLNWYYPHNSTPGWNGLVINFQLDGNYQQAPYSVYLDKLNLSYF